MYFEQQTFRKCTSPIYACYSSTCNCPTLNNLNTFICQRSFCEGSPKSHLESTSKSHQRSPMLSAKQRVSASAPPARCFCQGQGHRTIERSPTEVPPCLWGLDGSTIAWSLHGASIACHLVEASSFAKKETGKPGKNTISEKDC